MCYNKHHIDDYKNNNKYSYDIPYIKADKPCSYFVINEIPEEILEKLKFCFSCKSNYKNQCTNKQVIEDVMFKIRKYQLPISSLIMVNQPDSKLCSH